jgi:hypothetical protein
MMRHFLVMITACAAWIGMYNHLRNTFDIMEKSMAHFFSYSVGF